jgi:hypothetical protein
MKNDILKPTPQQIKVRNRLWAEALKKNKKKAFIRMYDDGGRCCLAVAQDVAQKCGVRIPDINDRDKFYPQKDVTLFFGWSGNDPLLETPLNNKISASSLNDADDYSFGTSNGMSHKKIAECVMNTFVHPKNKVWSFKLKPEVE